MIQTGIMNKEYRISNHFELVPTLPRGNAYQNEYRTRNKEYRISNHFELVPTLLRGNAYQNEYRTILNSFPRSRVGMHTRMNIEQGTRNIEY